MHYWRTNIIAPIAEKWKGNIMDEQVKSAEKNDAMETDVAVENTAVNTEVANDHQESESQSTPEAKSQKPTQTKEENAEFARVRREKERAQELQKARAEAEAAERVKNVIEYVKTNPYNNKPITNATEVNQYLRMKRIHDSGGDPIGDYASEIDREEQAKKDEANKQAESQAKIQSDVSDFRKAYPEVDLPNLLTNDDLFRLIMENNINNENKKPLKEVYGDYLRIRGKYEKEAENKTVEKVAKQKSGVGTADKGVQKPTYTKADILKMPYAEAVKFKNENPALYRSIMGK